MDKTNKEGIFSRGLNRINHTGELLLPRRSTRRFITHLGLAAMVTLGVGHNLIDRASNPLEKAVDKQGDKVGKKVDDMNASAAEKLQYISDYAKPMYAGILQVVCYLKEVGVEIDISFDECNKVGSHDRVPNTTSTIHPPGSNVRLPGIEALLNPKNHNP